MNRALLILLVGVAASPLWAQAPAAPQLKAGAATSNITPPLGSAVIGGFVPFPATHVHDELLARCLVLDDGHTRLAVVVCDLLGVQRVLSEEARKLIQERLKIPSTHVLICATHTHSAASALGQDRLKLGPTLDDYQQFVARRIADGVQCAVNNLRPAQIAFVKTAAPEHVNNRRWLLKPGTMPPNPFGGTDQAKMNPPAGSPDLVEPAGPTDPVISVLALREPNGRPLAVAASYSLHYVGGVGAGHISADYYGMYCAHLTRLLGAERLDPPFVPLMANGTSGDVNNINFRQPRPAQGPYVQMRKVAEDVAQKVHAALAKAEYRDYVSLAASYREPSVAWRRPTPEELAWAKKTIAERPQTPGKADLSFIYAERVQRLGEYPATTTVPLQVLRIGDIGIGTLPCEVLCEIGLEFKQRSPLQPACLISLAHGYFGYLPTPRQHALGGYETWLGTSRLETQASEKLLAALLEMAAELRRSPPTQ